MEQSKPLHSNKRSRGDATEENDLPEVKRLGENLLDDDEVEFYTTTEDLDSLMKSFQEEIASSLAGESRPELGYLLKASDDELGLPPTSVVDELVRVESYSSEFWDEPGFDSFGFDETEKKYCDGVEYPALDGLFDDSDLGLGLSGFSWMPETLPDQSLCYDDL